MRTRYPNTPTAAERKRQTIERIKTTAAALALGILTAAAMLLLAAATL